MMILPISLLLNCTVSQAVHPKFFHTPSANETSVSVAADDAICQAHLSSVFRKHHWKVLFANQSLVLYFHVSASEPQVRLILEREAPRSTFQYAIGKEAMRPPIQRKWIQVLPTLNAYHQDSPGHKLPPHVLKWLRNLVQNDAALADLKYAPIQYLENGRPVTGYLLHEEWSAWSVPNEYRDEQLLAGQSVPFKLKFIKAKRSH